ncbi:hypothetical protein GMDG_08109 [Pseudogymnoascus destructans 20631-21]|uniref:PNPLA domain-containing protein n=1 Tax=Pseudogymnoascus destructans (strain ATCC MYA-4855 / 20631-21) TaxID=658429 RepID=L8G106_PSED2|nr:hypothetical protein GMDG_08109 [Pseudogymnoascus destructans 20631-21]
MTPSGEVGREMKVWEAARATSAASPYFKPYKGYHDGGLGGHNNPVNLALWEQDLLWDRKGKQPDFVLSLGTGSTIESIDGSDTQGNKNASWISQLFLPRLNTGLAITASHSGFTAQSQSWTTLAACKA